MTEQEILRFLETSADNPHVDAVLEVLRAEQRDLAADALQPDLTDLDRSYRCGGAFHLADAIARVEKLRGPQDS